MRRSLVVVTLAVTAFWFATMGASAQKPSLTDHPMVGAWMVTLADIGPGLWVVHPDGTTFSTGPLSSVMPTGVSFGSPMVGTWEPTGPRTIHGTGVGYFSDANGMFTGSLTFEGSDTVNEDGLSYFEEPGSTITIRDAQNNIVNTFPGGGAAVTGRRMEPDSPGFSEDSYAAPTVAP